MSMSMRDAIKQMLEGDATLMALLPGGIYSGREISRQEMPSAFDENLELRPCALIKVETETPSGPYDTSARLIFSVWLYQRAGYDAIDAAMKRVFELLNRVVMPGQKCWEIRHSDDVTDQTDDSLMTSMGMSRYVAIRMRGVQ
jgi:hypothetical protein